ncbi:hypothetical protein E4U38_003172 [Claviceps purpurea]|nr:hypothetical protein E4U38_003172 [Claviceps purpurea]
MVDPTAMTEAPIVAEPLTETQSLEEINVDTPTVETPSTAPTAEMPTTLTEGATPDDQPMDDLQNCQGDHVEHRQDSDSERDTARRSHTHGSSIGTAHILHRGHP